jgi:hypothetical protein
MAKVIVNGSIGRRQPLEVRAGHTLTPQIAVLTLASGQTLDTDGASLVLRIFRGEADLAELSVPGGAFDVPERLPDDVDGSPRFLITQTKERLAAVLEAAGPEPTSSGKPRTARTLYWTCSYQDAGGALFPVYYGTFTVWLGAAGD